MERYIRWFLRLRDSVCGREILAVLYVEMSSRGKGHVLRNKEGGSLAGCG